MIDISAFRSWLKINTEYSDAVVKDIVSRMKRTDSILAWDGNAAYLFFLGENTEFKKLTPCVRSQLRKAARLYSSFFEQTQTTK